MKTLRLALAGAVAVVVALFATLGPAFAYPITVNLSVTGGTVVGGEPIKVTATADSTCLELSITYLGETVSTSNAATFSHTFDTRKVTKVESDPVTADCSFDNGEEPDALGGGGAGKLSTGLVQVLDNAHAVNTITLLPPSGGDGGGLLPNTGGERLAWLLIGGLLVVVGGGAIVASRRRTS